MSANRPDANNAADDARIEPTVDLSPVASPEPTPPETLLHESDSLGSTPEPTCAPSELKPAGKSDGLLNRRLGNYVLLSEIARGGMGVVFRARDETLNRIVALKMILSGQFATERDVRRFYIEAEASANLDHPGIVPIYEVGKADGHHYFSMKLIEGGSLDDRLDELRHDHSQAAELIAQIARAVHYAHQRGILHRDLKPANILLDTDGTPLVSDLGLAKDVSSDSGLTHTGAIMGTPSYMAPEQAEGQKEITTAADIYSIGAMLYEVLTGRVPHEGKNPVDTIRMTIELDAGPLRAINPKVHRTLELICLKCLARNPDQRYASAKALADDLDNWRSGKPVSARPPSVWSTVGQALRQNVKSAIGAALLGLVAGMLAGISLWQQNELSTLDVAAIYDQFPDQDAPSIWALNFPWKIPGLISLALITSMGLVIIAVSRPKSAAEALGLGLVAGLTMMVSVYTLALGSNTISYCITSAIGDESDLLAKMALGTVEEQTDARQALFRKYPELEYSANDVSGLMMQKLQIDRNGAIPKGIIVGVLAAALGSLLPAVGGTLLAWHLYRQRVAILNVLVPYFEASLVFFVFTGVIGTIYTGRLMDPHMTSTYVSSWLFPCILALAVGALVWGVANRAHLGVRIVLHLAWFSAALWYGAEMRTIRNAHEVAMEQIASGEIQSARDRLEKSLASNRGHDRLSYDTGIIQAYLGNRSRHRALCEPRLKIHDYSADRLRSQRTAKLCLLLPHTETLGAGIRIAKSLVNESPGESAGASNQLVRALAAYREGDFPAVYLWTGRCRDSLVTQQTQVNDDRVLLSNQIHQSTCDVLESMAAQRERRNADAWRHLASATERLEPIQDMSSQAKLSQYWDDYFVYRILLLEAQTLIGAI